MYIPFHYIFSFLTQKSAKLNLEIQKQQILKFLYSVLKYILDQLP